METEQPEEITASLFFNDCDGGSATPHIYRISQLNEVLVGHKKGSNKNKMIEVGHELVLNNAKYTVKSISIEVGDYTGKDLPFLMDVYSPTWLGGNTLQLNIKVEKTH